MRSRHYILDDANNPIALPIDEIGLTPTIVAHGQWLADNQHRLHVGDDTIGETRCSTVFLGWAIGFGEPPDVFETMLFQTGWSKRSLVVARYATWAEAATGHAVSVAALKEGYDPWQS
jgi:hypothetical protein